MGMNNKLSRKRENEKYLVASSRKTFASAETEVHFLALLVRTSFGGVAKLLKKSYEARSEGKKIKTRFILGIN